MMVGPVRFELTTFRPPDGRANQAAPRPDAAVYRTIAGAGASGKTHPAQVLVRLCPVRGRAGVGKGGGGRAAAVARGGKTAVKAGQRIAVSGKPVRVRGVQPGGDGLWRRLGPGGAGKVVDAGAVGFDGYVDLHGGLEGDRAIWVCVFPEGQAGLPFRRGTLRSGPRGVRLCGARRRRCLNRY